MTTHFMQYLIHKHWKQGCIAVAIVFCVPLVDASIAPNGDFEEGRETVASWTLESGRGAWESSGYESGRSLSVTGDGNDDAGWNSVPIAVKPGHCYEISFMAKQSKGAAGGIFAGADCAHRDYWLSEEWKSYLFIFRVPDDRTEIRLRVGQWRLQGSAYFDRVALREVQPLYPQSGLWKFGLGEALYESEYQAQHLLASNFSNSVRFLASATAGFNSNRWLFSTGSQITYIHHLEGEMMNKASATLQLNNYTGGQCTVLASKDGENWIRTGFQNDDGSTEYVIPDSLLPAETLYVRIQGDCDEKGDCAFQIRNYVFQATLNRTFPLISGDTVALIVDECPSDLDVSGVAISKLVSGQRALFDLKVTNNGPADLVMRAEIEGRERSETMKAKPFKVKSGTSFDSLLDIPITGVGEQAFKITLKSSPRSQTIATAELRLKIPILEDNEYGQTLSVNDAGTFWWCDATRKISQTRGVPHAKSTCVEIAAAKGEYAPFQLVFYPTQPCGNVTVDWSALASKGGETIPKECLEVLRVEYVPIRHPSDSLGSIGMWPDPLPPYTGPFSVEANRNYPLWITVHVPREIDGGVYQGEIKIHAGESNVSVPVRVDVYDFVLPEKMQLQSGFGFHAGQLRKYHNLKTDEELREVFDLYMQDFSAHRISPYNPVELDPFRYELRKGDDGIEHYTFDFSNFDRAGKRYFDELGFTGYRLDLEGLGGGTFHERQAGKIGNYEQGTPEHERLFAEFAGTVESHMKEMGWLDRCYVYWFDEPDPKDYDFVKEGMNLIHKHAPGLRRYLTEQPEDVLADSVDVWCLLIDHYDEEICKKHQNDGDEIWWYICTGPKAPYPGLFIDHYAVEMRAWLWMTYKYNLQGILVWQTNYWTSPTAYPAPAIQNPWTDPMSWVVGYGVKTGTKQPWGNGDGRFLYPPKNWTSGDTIISGPVRSIRWELLREGVEDWEYFNALKTCLESGNLSKAKQKEGERLLEIPEEIVGGLTEFAKDPQVYDEYRDAIGRFLSEVSK